MLSICIGTWERPPGLLDRDVIGISCSKWVWRRRIHKAFCQSVQRSCGGRTPATKLEGGKVVLNTSRLDREEAGRLALDP